MSASEYLLKRRNLQLFLLLLTVLLIPMMLTAKKLPPEWILNTKVSNVECYYQIKECAGKKVVFLRFKNLNTKEVKISWKEVFVTVEEKLEKTLGPFELKQLTLASGETYEQDCENIKINELLTRPKQLTPVYQANVIKFSFTNIQVTH